MSISYQSCNSTLAQNATSRCTRWRESGLAHWPLPKELKEHWFWIFWSRWAPYGYQQTSVISQHFLSVDHKTGFFHSSMFFPYQRPLFVLLFIPHFGTNPESISASSNLFTWLIAVCRSFTAWLIWRCWDAHGYCYILINWWDQPQNTPKAGDINVLFFVMKMVHPIASNLTNQGFMNSGVGQVHQIDVWDSVEACEGSPSWSCWVLFRYLHLSSSSLPVVTACYSRYCYWYQRKICLEHLVDLIDVDHGWCHVLHGAALLR